MQADTPYQSECGVSVVYRERFFHNLHRVDDMSSTLFRTVYCWYGAQPTHTVYYSMKNKHIFVITAMLMSTTAFAQFTHSGGRNPSSVEKGWNSIYASYNMLKYSQEMFGYNKAYNGFSIGYDRAIGLTSKIPFYVEIGGAIQYAGQNIKANDEDNVKATSNLLSVKVPVSILYRWNVANSNWSIIPKAGFDGRFNVLGKGKETYTDSDYSHKLTTTTNRYNMFKEGENGKDGYNGLNASGDKCSRFQVGWHVGANVEYKSLLLGITYGADMNAFCKEYYESISNIHFKTLSITIGYKF